MTRSTLIDLNPHKLRCYPFMVSLNIFNRSCNTLDGLLSRICFPDKTEDIYVFNNRNK